MPRVLLILPTATYRAADFLEAARRLGAEVVVASEEDQALAGEMGPRALRIDLCDPQAATEAIAGLAQEHPLDAVIAVDDEGVVAAAEAARRLGLPHNPPEAVRATRDKIRMRELLSDAGVRQPEWRVIAGGGAVEPPSWPCVLKATSLSASRGVIRADDAGQAERAAARIRAMLDDPQAPLLAEQYIPGREVAVEGILRSGRLDVLAVFDKPDPLEGPFFEETIYVTPSRLPEGVQDEIRSSVASAVAAIGLREGPVHAEARIDGQDRVWILEAAARSIGGLCARSLRFGMGVSLEELILRHALGLRLDTSSAAWGASGVMMIPIPREGVLRRVDGSEEALAVPGIAGLEITIPLGRTVRPLPEGDRYLGFLFARAGSPEEVEAALREGHAKLEVEIQRGPD